MSKNIAELVVKMKNETSLSVETMGDSTDQVYMAAIAVAHTPLQMPATATARRQKSS